jgi:RND family efflux transporter MFP subunit
MKNVFWILTVALVFALTACGSSATPTAIPTVALDSGSQTSSVTSGKASASGIVVPVKKVELAFPLSGVVKTVEVTAGDSVTAGQPLVTLETAILEAKVKEADAAVVTEKTQLAYLVRTGSSQERFDAAQAKIDSAQAAADIAKAQLAQATLAAPFDGTIASVKVSPAEFASSGQVVIVMGDLTHFQIETTDLSEKNVHAVKIGQAATVFIDALGQGFSGKVTDIARVSETVGGDVVFKVTVELDKQPEGLRWGMSTEVNVETK